MGGAMDRQQVFGLFLQLAGLDEAQGEPWEPLCEAACAQLEGQLREGADPEDIRLALAAAACAAHWQGLAAGGQAQSFTVGEISVSGQTGTGEGAGELWQALLAAAAPLLAPQAGAGGLWQVQP